MRPLYMKHKPVWQRVTLSVFVPAGPFTLWLYVEAKMPVKVHAVRLIQVTARITWLAQVQGAFTVQFLTVRMMTHLQEQREKSDINQTSLRVRFIALHHTTKNLVTAAEVTLSVLNFLFWQFTTSYTVSNATIQTQHGQRTSFRPYNQSKNTEVNGLEEFMCHGIYMVLQGTFKNTTIAHWKTVVC